MSDSRASDLSQIAEKLAYLVEKPLVILAQQPLEIGVGQIPVADPEQLVGGRVGLEYLMIEADHHHSVGSLFEYLIEIEVRAQFIGYLRQTLAQWRSFVVALQHACLSLDQIKKLAHSILQAQ